LPAGRTLLESVAEALPGTALRLDFAGAKLEHRSLPDVRTDITLTSEAEATQLVCAELAAAVRRRTADLYTLGLALSGGIDSIAIAFILRRLYPEREIHTFTTGCGPEDPEMATAARVAARIGARHHEVLTPPELLDGALIKLVWHLEDPVARTEALQLLQLGQAARPYVDVLVSGQGADSLFAGMPKYILFELTRYLPLLRGGLEELYYLSQLSLPPRTLAGRMLEWLYRRGRVPAVPLVPGASMPSRPELPPPGPERINRIIAAGLPGSVAAGLRKFERAFAAAGLEHRAPFCDPRLARLAFRVSDRLKVRGWGNKHILRRALATLVDREFLAVPKRTQKMYCDFDFAMALDAAARDVLSLDQVASRGLFDPDTIAALFHRPPGRAYAPEAAMRIWTVLLTEHWARLFVDGRGMLPENLRQAA
jgi:asparagine synthase (glutamine-hydrolysing)